MTYGILFPRKGVLPMLRQLLLILPLVLVAGCTASPAQEPAQELDLTLPEGDVLTDIDTHGGFHGDGNSCLILAFSPENGEALAQELAGREDWYPLPLDEQSAHVLDSTLSLLEDDGFTYTLPTQGWYWYLDRSPEGHQLEFPLNCTLAIYDSQSDQLAYFRSDA